MKDATEVTYESNIFLKSGTFNKMTTLSIS